MVDLGRVTAATDFIVSDNYEEKEKSQSWNKSSKILTLNGDNNGFKKPWKNGNTLKTTDKSTLSFQIASYKNPIAVDLFDNENIEGLKKEKFGSIKTSKHTFAGHFISQNPFEFPRQQNGDKKNEPEVMQFKASQKLLDSERPTPSQPTGPLVSSTSSSNGNIDKETYVGRTPEFELLTTPKWIVFDGSDGYRRPQLATVKLTNRDKEPVMFRLRGRFWS
uniref:Uncharacterized protein n=1 Tax=Panagrolaimus davidi TaxID=227884 RepID=A0A914QY03_9BILA